MYFPEEDDQLFIRTYVVSPLTYERGPVRYCAAFSRLHGEHHQRGHLEKQMQDVASMFGQ